MPIGVVKPRLCPVKIAARRHEVRKVANGADEAGDSGGTNQLLAEISDLTRRGLHAVFELHGPGVQGKVVPGFLDARAVGGVDRLRPVIDALVGRDAEHTSVFGIDVGSRATVAGVVDGHRGALEQRLGDGGAGFEGLGGGRDRR